jgi:hypothetical protein
MDQTFFSTPKYPDQLQVPPSLLFHGYQEVVSSRVKQPGHETAHPPYMFTQVKDRWSYTPIPHMHSQCASGEPTLPLTDL